MRPTSDLVRGAIFDILTAQQADLSRVLDLYAGSGALGIEALSRGAGWCDFVEHETRNVSLIRGNLALTGMEERGRVHRCDVARAPERLKGSYTVVLADPPYDDATAFAALENVACSPLTESNTTFVVEHGHRQEPPQTLGRLPLISTRRYGDSRVSVYHG